MHDFLVSTIQIKMLFSAKTVPLAANIHKIRYLWENLNFNASHYQKCLIAVVDI